MLERLIYFLIATVILLVIALLHVAYLTYAERKVIARMQQRLGLIELVQGGYFSLLQIC